MAAPERIVFVTRNAGKVAEARAALGVAGFAVEQDAGGYTEVQAGTLEEVARAGAREVAGRLQKPFFLDDSGLFVDALRGFPGVYSAHALATLGIPGLLKLLDGVADRRARFECVIAWCREPPWAPVEAFRGACQGRISASPRGGSHGFGFDPVFVPDGDTRAFSEIPMEEKNLKSHRGLALAALVARLRAKAPMGKPS